MRRPAIAGAVKTHLETAVRHEPACGTLPGYYAKIATTREAGRVTCGRCLKMLKARSAA